MSQTAALMGVGDSMGGRGGLEAGLLGQVRTAGRWDFVCYRRGWRTTVLKHCLRAARLPGGRRLRAFGERLAAPMVKWQDAIGQNIVVNAGINYALDAALSGGTPVTSWYLGLTDGTPTVAAGDTMSSHAGWVEVTAYDEANRQAWTDGGVSSQSVSNSGSPAVFTISTNGTDVGGAFLSSNNTKGGSTGTLYAAGAFSAGDKSLDDGDTLTVTATFTGSAA